MNRQTDRDQTTLPVLHSLVCHASIKVYSLYCLLLLLPCDTAVMNLVTEGVMVPWNHLGARTLGGYLQTSLAKKGRPVRNVEAPSHGLWSWLNKRMYKKRNWVKHQHPLLSASWLKCLTPLLPVLPAWWTLYLLLNHEQKQITLLSYSYRIFFHNH